MKTIITPVRTNAFAYAVLAVIAAAVVFFAVLPSFPDVSGGAGGPSLVALFANANGGAPTATLTVNGQHDVMVKKGSTINYAWTSTGGTSWSSEWTSEGGYCGTSGTWVADTAQGTYSWPADVSQVDCTYTITYHVSGPGGSASDTIHVTVYETLPPSCTIVAEPNPCTLGASGTCATTITWSTQNMNAPALYIEGSKDILALAKSGSYVANSITATPVTFVIHEDWQFSPPPPVICAVTVKGIGTPSYACTGTIPSHASAWDAEESTGLSNDTLWVHGDPDGTPKCQFHCDSGYVWNGTSCVLPVGPTCTLDANPTTINQGQGSTLTWTTTGATKDVTLDGVSVATNGTKVVMPNNTTTYTLVASNYNTSVTCTKTVTIIPPASAPVCSLTFNGLTNATNVDPLQSRVWAWSSANGSTYSMTATVTNCEDPSQNGTFNPWQPWVGNVGDITGGSNTGVPGASKYGCQGVNTYTVTNSAGVSKTCTVNLSFKNSPPPPPSAPTCTLTANPSTITQGQSSTLSWTTTNATGVSINQGVGAVASQGTKSVSPSNTTTYTLTATGAGGTVTCQKTVTVIPKPNAPTCTLAASPSQLPAGGGQVNLVWDTTNATNVSFNNGIGTVGLGGSKTVFITETTTFILTATGQGGTVTCQKTVTVTPPAPLPTCTLSANPTTINQGQSATLSWTTMNATSVSINQGIGAVATNGSKSVSPSVTTTYTLTAENDAGIVHCSKTITVIIPPPAPSCTLTVNPTSITKGDSATLSWSSQNATVATIDNGIGNVTLTGTKSVSPSVTTTYTLTVTGAGGTTTCKATLAVNEPPAKPTCSLTADKEKILAGESATLTWTSTNGKSATLNSAPVALSGSKTVSPITTTKYTFIVTGDGGTATCEKTIVVEPYVPVPPSCTFTAAPAKITKGESSTLTWTTANATSVSIDQGIGAVPLSGNKTVTPTANTTYTLTATRAATDLAPAASVTCVTSIVVEDEPEPKPLTCDAFSASPSTLAAPGDTTLSWNTSNATVVTIDQGIGSVPVDGTKVVAVSTTTLYTLTATDGEDTVTCQTKVTIKPNVIVPKCDAFTASPTEVSKGGTATLIWNTTNATNVSINNGVGSVAQDGNTNVTVNEDTTYTLTASNGDASDTCQATVTVKSSGGGGGSSSPRCTLTASDKSISSGEKVTLTWKNTRTDRAVLKDNRGNTIFDTKKDDDIDEDADSTVVKPTKSTAYTLTVYRGSKHRDCTVDINVSNVTMTSNRTPLVAGISLTSVPYTGFDAGPALTAFFYVMLALWGLIVAYVLVYRDGKVWSFSLRNALPAFTFPRRAKDDTSALQIPAHVVAPTVTPSPIRVETERELSASTAAPVSAYAPVIGYESLYGADAPVIEIANPRTDDDEVYEDDEPDGGDDEGDDEEDDFGFFENRAHDARILTSSEALRFILGNTQDRDAQIATFDAVIELAKSRYPSENGWVILNKERLLSLMR